MSAELKIDQEIKNQYSHSPSNDILFKTITFTIYEQLYAMDILFIRDIVMGKKIYCIPNSDPLLLGVTNIRGEILPVYSLKKILDHKETSLSSNQMILKPNEDQYFIIMKLDQHLFAVDIDKINKNITVTRDIFNDSSYMSKWSEDTIFNGIIIDGQDNILMIDAHQLIKLLMRRIKKFSLQ